MAGWYARTCSCVASRLRKRVALKTLRQSLAKSGEARVRFIREGETASRLRHPNVVDITDVGDAEGVPFLVMELLEGESLDYDPATEETSAPIQVWTIGAAADGSFEVQAAP